MPASVNPQRRNKLRTFAIFVGVVVVTLVVASYTRQIDAAAPSLFRSHLTDDNYLFLQRWWPLSTAEAFYGLLIPMVMLTAVASGNRAARNVFPAARLVSRVLILCAVVAGLIVFAYAPMVGGYAVYSDHLIVRDPFRDLSVLRIEPRDIDHVETGCHPRIAGGHSPNWRVPSYRIVLRGGGVVSLFDLAAGGYDDDPLMESVLAFDAQVSANHVPKRLRKNFLGKPMNDEDCYARMEAHYNPALTADIRQTFESN